MPRTRPLSTLMLVGSSTTDAMAELSELYARDAVRALAGVADVTLIRRAPDGRWSLPWSLEPHDIASAMPMPLSAALGLLVHEHFDIGLPQMFCPWGMTSGRALFELLDIPMIGNRAPQMGMGADKALARAVVAQGGVRVPEGVVVKPGERSSQTPPLPVIVKPVMSDNSEGLSLVERAEDLAPAIAHAHAQDSDALVERFIPPGRELRVGVIERMTPDGPELFALPPEEYPVDRANHPVRTAEDKLARGDDGQLRLAAKTKDAAWIIDADDPAIPALHAAAIAACRALGCRHYGLFDFRVDEAGTPWFLEAGLYCSFADASVVCTMARAAGISTQQLFVDMAALASGESVSVEIADSAPVLTETLLAAE